MPEPKIGGEDLREQLADIEHQRWADWQRYVHGLCTPAAGGALTVPASLVERWERQIGTSYDDLTDAEKAADRHQVDRYWHLLAARLAELEAARPVVEAADAYVKAERATTVAEDDEIRPAEEARDMAFDVLAWSVDLYRSATTRNLDSALPDPSLAAETLPTTEEKS